MPDPTQATEATTTTPTTPPTPAPRPERVCTPQNPLSPAQAKELFDAGALVEHSEFRTVDHGDAGTAQQCTGCGLEVGGAHGLPVEQADPESVSGVKAE